MADIKISQSLFIKTETTITMRWTANVICDILWWSVDNGETWTELNITDGKGGSYTIGGLDPNANYSVKTRVRRKGTSSTATSTSLSVITFDYPHAEEMPNFTIGERVTIGIYNPMNRSVTVSVIGANNSEVWSEETTGQSVSGLNEDLTQEMLYMSIPNAKQGSYKVKVTSGSNITTKDGGIYSVNENLCRPVIASVSYQDTDSDTVAITGNDQDIVRNRSVVRYTASGLSAKHSASIVSCSLEVNGDSYSLAISGTSATGGNAEIDSATDVDAVFTVTDSRGISSKRVMTIHILDWHFPSALVTLERQGNYKTETDLTVNAVYPSVNGHNTITITYSATKEGDSSPSVTGSINDGQTKVINLDNAFAWSVEITLTDRFGVSSTYGARVSKGTPAVFYDRKKESVGVNCYPQKEKSLEVDGYDVLNLNGFEIDDGEDFDDLTTPRSYYGNASSGNYAHCPVNSGTFTLVVMEAGETGQLMQEVIPCNKTSSLVYRRFYSQNSWGNWLSVGGGSGGGLTFDDIYPVGSIYMSVGSTSPATLFGGTWVQIEDTFLLASGANYANGATGGEATHTLTASESGLPAHTHGFTQPSVDLGSHSHYAVDADTDRWFVETNNDSVANTTVASSSSGNRRVYGLSASSGNPFTRSKTTGATDLGSKTATGGAVGAVTGGAKNATSAHNNMPPYLAVNVWKRIA